MELIGVLVREFTPTKYKIIIGERTKNYKEGKIFYSQEYEKLDDLVVGAKDISRKFVIETFVLIVDQYNAVQNFKDGFDFDKNGDFLFEEFEKLESKYNTKKCLLINSLEDLDKKFNVVDPPTIYEEISKILRLYIPPMKEIPEDLQPKTDRDFLDISIEMFCLLYAKAHDLEYGIDIYPKGVEDHPFAVKLLKYKMDKYGNEILKDLGMEIVRKTKDGFIIKEKGPKYFN